VREILDNGFRCAGINVDCITPVALYSLFEGIEDDRSDPSNINQKQITVAHEIRKIFLVLPKCYISAVFVVTSWPNGLKTFCHSTACLMACDSLGQVSDNQAFNRLFSFVGHRTINQAM